MDEPLVDCLLYCDWDVKRFVNGERHKYGFRGWHGLVVVREDEDKSTPCYAASSGS